MIIVFKYHGNRFLWNKSEISLTVTSRTVTSTSKVVAITSKIVAIISKIVAITSCTVTIIDRIVAIISKTVIITGSFVTIFTSTCTITNHKITSRTVTIYSNTITTSREEKKQYAKVLFAIRYRECASLARDISRPTSRFLVWQRWRHFLCSILKTQSFMISVSV